MKSFRNIQRQIFSSSLLIIGLTLQLAMPLADAALVYRFTSWLTINGQVEAKDLEKILAQSPSINDLAHAAAAQADPASEQKTDANKMLDEFIVQSSTQEHQNRSASLNKVPDELTYATQTPTQKFRLLTYFDRLNCNSTQVQRAKAPVGQLDEALKNKAMQVPPKSGQSSLAP